MSWLPSSFRGFLPSTSPSPQHLSTGPTSSDEEEINAICKQLDAMLKLATAEAIKQLKVRRDALGNNKKTTVGDYSNNDTGIKDEIKNQINSYINSDHFFVALNAKDTTIIPYYSEELRKLFNRKKASSPDKEINADLEKYYTRAILNQPIYELMDQASGFDPESGQANIHRNQLAYWIESKVFNKMERKSFSKDPFKEYSSGGMLYDHHLSTVIRHLENGKSSKKRLSDRKSELEVCLDSLKALLPNEDFSDLTDRLENLEAKKFQNK